MKGLICILTLLITAHRTNYLLEAMLSVAAQSCKEFHVICVADVSKEERVAGFFESFKSFVACKSFEVISVKGNGTAGYTRNFGFAHAQTEWVSYLDGDDVLMPDAIETVLAHIDSNPADIYSSGIVRIEQDGSQTLWEDSLDYYPPLKIYHEDPDSVNEPTYFNHFQTIRRSIWEQYPYNEETNGEDIDYMLHHLLNGSYFKITRYLYAYRDTPNSFANETRYIGCDICTLRYNSGYYQALLEKNSHNISLSNFKKVGHENQAET